MIAAGETMKQEVPSPAPGAEILDHRPLSQEDVIRTVGALVARDFWRQFWKSELVLWKMPDDTLHISIFADKILSKRTVVTLVALRRACDGSIIRHLAPSLDEVVSSVTAALGKAIKKALAFNMVDKES